MMDQTTSQLRNIATEWCLRACSKFPENSPSSERKFEVEMEPCKNGPNEEFFFASPRP